MKVFGTTEAAAEIGCDPRALRRFLRSNDSWRNVGIGGRYAFSEAEVRSLAKQLKAAGQHAPPKRRGQRVVEQSSPLDQDPGVTLEKFESTRGDRHAEARLREERREARAARQQRLRTRMAEVLEERYDDEDAGDARYV